MYKLNFFSAASVALVASSFAGCDTSPIANLPGNNDAGVLAVASNDRSPQVELLSVGSDGISETPNASQPYVELIERLWQDYDYTFNTDATLTGFTADMSSVKLLKSNGVDIVVEVDILSKEDKEYLQRLPESQRAMLAE